MAAGPSLCRFRARAGGFRIQWKRKRGSNKWYVYTFIADRPFRSVKAKIRALTPRTSQHDLRALLIRINQITRGWTNYFKHAIAQRIFSKLQHHTWWRIVRMMRTRHRWKWMDVRRWLTDPTGRWHPISAGGIELFNPETIPIIRYRYRGNQIPNLGPGCLNPRQRPWRARCGESRTPGSASGLGKRTSSNAGTAPQADSTVAPWWTQRRSAHEDAGCMGCQHPGLAGNREPRATR